MTLPPKTYSINSHNNILILINTSYFNTIFPKDAGMLLLFNKNDILLNQDTYLLPSYSSGKYLGSKAVIDNKKYTVYSYVSKETKLKLVNLVPSSFILKEPTILLFIVIMVLIILFFCFFSISYLMKLTYLPIIKFNELTGTPIENNKDEITTASASIINTMQENKILSDRINQISSNDNLILSILNGSNENFDLDLPIFHGDYFVAVVNLNNITPIDMPELGEIIKQIKTTILTSDDYVVTTLKEIVFVILHSENCEHKLFQIKNFLNKKSYIATIGVGNRYVNWTDLWCSFSEALTATEYKFVFGADKIIRFADIELNSTTLFDYPKAQIQQIDYYINKGDIDSSLKIADEVISSLQQENVPLFFARCISFDIINSLLKALYEKHSIKRKEILLDLQFSSLMKIETIEQLVNIIHNLFAVYNQFNNEVIYDDSESVILMMKEYMEKNFTKADFSVSTMSKDLHFSRSYLGKLFKEKTGKNISDYIAELQINYAKQLLTTTDLTINEITNKLGQANPSNFIRKFKNYTGLTPGEYRKLSP